MDSRIPPVRSDVVTVPSAARPTPTPVRVSFGEVLARGAGALVAGAEAAMNVLPGGPLVAAAIRNGIGGGSSGSHPMLATGNGGLSSAMNAEGPSPVGGGGSSVGGGFGAGGASGAGGAGGTGAAGGGIEQSLQQSQEMNMYYLQIQQEVDQQNRTFTTLSNVLKAENDTVKNAIGNIR